MLRLLFFILSLSIGFASCKNSGQTDSKSSDNESVVKKAPQFVFVEEIHNFGRLKRGIKVSHTFEFTNGGDTDLVITKVDKGCSCTQVNWPQHAIKPKQTEYIEVILDTHGQSGNLYRVATLYSNATQKEKELTITAIIE